MTPSAIGGFFELELPRGGRPFHGGAGHFQSARAAFLALLLAGTPRRIWMPYYICSTMVDSARQAGVDLAFYDIDEHFRIPASVWPEKGEWLVYVNYFGVCGNEVEALMDRYDRAAIVIDSSQSLFSPPAAGLATIYSPRKFLGIPDGGLLVSTLGVPEPDTVDQGSYVRALPLIKRAAFSPEVAYQSHVEAEHTLFYQQPMQMSRLTRRMLASIDLEKVRQVRNRNFAYLHRSLGHINLLPIEAATVNGPLCYPLLTKYSTIRDYLISKRIYVPTYWKDVLDMVSPSSFEAFLVRHLVPLPCDQRYGEKEMKEVVAACESAIQRESEDDRLQSEKDAAADGIARNVKYLHDHHPQR
ncbi:hypothetical protein [Noviherbaspirillum sp. ST9]|uniref:hypothetical protein n=1 Tax=Noviherbaspirillum sp. ST9 TaxID=3401606 RepID=UPI003B585C88